MPDDPARKTGNREISYTAEVLRADPNYYPEYFKVTEFEFSNGRKFEGFWQTRGPYQS
jgi:hypothetical protein